MFLGDERAGLKLEILGYQFPEGDLGYYDNNWLLVKLTAWTPAGTWERTDPMLDTLDPAYIASWLTAMVHGQQVDEWVRFTEPNLAFRFGEYRGEVAVVDVCFDLEARAPWRELTDGQVEPEMRLTIDRAQLDQAVRDLRAAAEHFPERQESPEWAAQFQD